MRRSPPPCLAVALRSSNADMRDSKPLVSAVISDCWVMLLRLDPDGEEGLDFYLRFRVRANLES